MSTLPPEAVSYMRRIASSRQGNSQMTKPCRLRIYSLSFSTVARAVDADVSASLRLEMTCERSSIMSVDRKTTHLCFTGKLPATALIEGCSFMDEGFSSLSTRAYSTLGGPYSLNKVKCGFRPSKRFAKTNEQRLSKEMSCIPYQWSIGCFETVRCRCFAH